MKLEFGEILKELREEKGLSQVELAKCIGVGKSIISYWELGQSYPTLPNLIALSDFFGVTLDYLAGRDK